MIATAIRDEARAIRDEARLRAQRHLDAALAIVDDLEVEPALQDALRHRLREMWKSASVAMSLVGEMDKQREVP